MRPTNSGYFNHDEIPAQSRFSAVFAAVWVGGVSVGAGVKGGAGSTATAMNTNDEQHPNTEIAYHALGSTRP